MPGTWVRPPQSGLLWTPPYWSEVDGGYAYHAGYWASEVGFYGGINYGFGYTGSGYEGGHWKDDSFTYNQAVNNLGSLDGANVYDQAVAVEENASHISYNGGARGTAARPTEQQETLANGRHIGPTPEQQKQFELAAMDRSLYSKLNNGEPGVAATQRAGILTGLGVAKEHAVEADRTIGSFVATMITGPGRERRQFASFQAHTYTSQWRKLRRASAQHIAQLAHIRDP